MPFLNSSLSIALGLKQYFLHEENITSRCKVYMSVCACMHVHLHMQGSVTLRVRIVQAGKEE